MAGFALAPLIELAGFVTRRLASCVSRIACAFGRRHGRFGLSMHGRAEFSPRDRSFRAVREVLEAGGGGGWLW
jgi:hypothetical protein